MGTTTRHTESTRGHLGQGLYSLDELRGYLSLSDEEDDGRLAYRWLSYVLNPVVRQPRRPDHSFSDLISLFVVRELLRRGVAPRTIREGEEHLRKVLETDRPFVHDSIQTDGRDIFADGAQITGQIEAATRSRQSPKRGQQVMLATVKDVLRGVHYVDGQAELWSPAEGIVLNPAIQFGEPVLTGTRLATAVVAEIADDRGVDAAAEQFRIAPGQARAAIAFERELAAARN